MDGNFLAFCHHQSTKMIEYAQECTNPLLKDQFLKMSAYWLKVISAPRKDANAITPAPTRAA